MAVTSPSCSILAPSPREGKAENPRVFLGARARLPFKMALSNQSRTPETREAGGAAVDGRLPPLRQLDIDPPSLTLSSAWERSPRRRRCPWAPRESRGAAPGPEPAPLPGDRWRRPGKAPGTAELPRSRSSRGLRRLPRLQPPFPFIFPPQRRQQRCSPKQPGRGGRAGQCRARLRERGRHRAAGARRGRARGGREPLQAFLPELRRASLNLCR